MDAVDPSGPNASYIFSNPTYGHSRLVEKPREGNEYWKDLDNRLAAQLGISPLWVPNPLFGLTFAGDIITDFLNIGTIEGSYFNPDVSFGQKAFGTVGDIALLLSVAMGPGRLPGGARRSRRGASLLKAERSQQMA